MIRLKNRDYSQNGFYFITICTQYRGWVFGTVLDGKCRLNKTGKIALKCWQQIPRHFPAVIIDEYIVMPDHIHGIIQIPGPTGNVGDADLRPDYHPRMIRPDNPRMIHPGIQNNRNRNIPKLEKKNTDRTKLVIPKIIQAYKSSVSRINNQAGMQQFRWQRSYHDHIIRNWNELMRVRKYIRNNPVNFSNRNK